MPSAGITLTELIDSRSIESKDGQWTGSRKFIAYNAAGDALTLGEVMNRSGLPKQTSKHPDQPILEVTGTSFSPMEDRLGTWECTVIYAGNESGTGTTAGHVSEQLNLTVKYVDVFRVDATPPLGIAHDVEIEGKAADTGGHPVSYPLPIVELRVTENVETAPDFLLLSNYVAKRNFSTFLGAPPRSVVYGGATSRKTSPTIWQVSHVFYADFHMMHLRQKADTDSNRNVAMGEGGADKPAPTGTSYAETVRWVDPFPATANLSNVLAYPIYF